MVFLFSFLATIIVGIGARDQALVASLTARQGARPAVLALALLSALASTAAATWAGVQVMPMLPAAARSMLVAMVLALAGFELLLIRPLREPEEPTESLFAFGVVLLAQQLTDAARLVIFALAAASPFLAATALGGAVGCCVTVLAGWMLGGDLQAGPLRTIRRVLGLILLSIAVWLAF